jgi:hypothetical protein
MLYIKIFNLNYDTITYSTISSHFWTRVLALRVPTNDSYYLLPFLNYLLDIFLVIAAKTRKQINFISYNLKIQITEYIFNFS